MLKYIHLTDELEAGIRSGTFQQGSRLPSIHTLSKRYGYSKSTVLAALNELVRRHMIYSVPRSGYYVVQRSSRVEGKEPIMIDFATSAPDPGLFPYLDFQHCINKAIDMYKNDLFIYGTPQGLPSLIKVMQRQLADSQVFAQERNIVITSGVQLALAVLALLPFPNGKKTILIEQPGYHLFIDHLLTHGLPVQGIYRTAQGIDMNRLEELFKTGDIKFFYTIPRMHSPLGVSYTPQQKKAIVELAHKYNVYVVEDDYMADLEQDSKSDPLFAYDTDSRVIYLKSFSKIIFPGLRIGIVVLPDSIRETFIRYKRSLDIDSSMLSQGALEIYIQSGMFVRHKEQLNNLYFSRAKQLDAALKRESAHSDGIFTYYPPKHPGIHTHLVLDEHLSVPQIIKQSKKHSIILEPMDKHYLPGNLQRNIIKLNVSHVSVERIDSGIAQLIELLRKEKA
ncbi:PLP-dependent aminotransferase family protein [Paenibacillus sp. D2_2]|uniref:aminotransferase-like domain-containing protein n=1 Tax=Paenibacillus sp. D2_2 TaxID=3073092 RepID=UPI002814EF9C|nr:PLP-dependent aminotransferase family protein [Paenibacillus sp. D2_2]WMT38796.1 PLP-dependent aminotransferase family protein [Paenibacillus sp. D2_2]